MKPVQCASCFMQSCVGGGHQEKEYCASHVHPEIMAEAKQIYARDTETRQLAKEAAIIESKGYMVWPRLKDNIKLARRMNYKKIGVVFCPDLMREAKKACRILTESGFTIISRACGVKKINPQAPEAFFTESGNCLRRGSGWPKPSRLRWVDKVCRKHWPQLLMSCFTVQITQ